MTYKKGLFIDKNKNVRFSLFFEKKSNILYEINDISQCITTIENLLNDILKVQKGELTEIDGETNMVIFNISKENTIVKNYLFNIESTLNTSFLVKLLESKLQLIKKNNIESIYEHIKKALILIKKNSITDNDGLYSIIFEDGIFIQFAIDREDLFLLNINDFMSKIKFDKRQFL